MSTLVIPCSIFQGDQSPLIKAPPQFRFTRHLPGPARDDVVAVAKRMSIARARRAPFSLRFAFHFIWLSIAVHTARATETETGFLSGFLCRTQPGTQRMDSCVPEEREKRKKLRIWQDRVSHTAIRLKGDFRKSSRVTIRGTGATRSLFLAVSPGRPLLSS